MRSLFQKGSTVAVLDFLRSITTWSRNFDNMVNLRRWGVSRRVRKAHTSLISGKLAGKPDSVFGLQKNVRGKKQKISASAGCSLRHRAHCSLSGCYWNNCLLGERARTVTPCSIFHSP